MGLESALVACLQYEKLYSKLAFKNECLGNMKSQAFIKEQNPFFHMMSVPEEGWPPTHDKAELSGGRDAHQWKNVLSTELDRFQWND
jgi:hypothetical protein